MWFAGDDDMRCDVIVNAQLFVTYDNHDATPHESGCFVHVHHIYDVVNNNILIFFN